MTRSSTLWAINSAIAVHRLVNIEPFCVDLCHGLLDDLLARDAPVDLVSDYVMPVPNNVKTGLTAVRLGRVEAR